MSWPVQMLMSLEGKTTQERFRIIQDHVKKCRAKYDEAQSELIAAERLMADVSREYMADYFGDKRQRRRPGCLGPPAAKSIGQRWASRSLAFTRAQMVATSWRGVRAPLMVGTPATLAATWAIAIAGARKTARGRRSGCTRRPNQCLTEEASVGETERAVAAGRSMTAHALTAVIAAAILWAGLSPWWIVAWLVTMALVGAAEIGWLLWKTPAGN